MADFFDDSLKIGDRSPGLGWIPTPRQILEFSAVIKRENDARDGISPVSQWDLERGLREGHDDD